MSERDWDDAEAEEMALTEHWRALRALKAKCVAAVEALGDRYGAGSVEFKTIQRCRDAVDAVETGEP
jgi:hypothetical protein